jgi:hypothetical protein
MTILSSHQFKVTYLEIRVLYIFKYANKVLNLLINLHVDKKQSTGLPKKAIFPASRCWGLGAFKRKTLDSGLRSESSLRNQLTRKN